MAAGVYLYHQVFYRRASILKHGFVAVVLLIAACAPFVAGAVLTTQEKARATAAVAAFQIYAPTAERLLEAQQLTDSWVYTYVNGGRVHQVIRLGDQWLTIDTGGE